MSFFQVFFSFPILSILRPYFTNDEASMLYKINNNPLYIYSILYYRILSLATMEKTGKAMSVMDGGRWWMGMRMMIVVLATIFRYFIRNTIEEIKCDVTTQIHRCF